MGGGSGENGGEQAEMHDHVPEALRASSQSIAHIGAATPGARTHAILKQNIIPPPVGIKSAGQKRREPLIIPGGSANNRHRGLTRRLRRKRPHEPIHGRKNIGEVPTNLDM